MKLAQLVLVLSIVGGGAAASFADEVESLYIRANEHYQKNDFASAIADYQKIVQLGFESWEVYYNLGNAFYKNGDFARAILNYERARKLDPKNEDINFNLALANLSVVDRIPQLPKFILYTWITELASLLNLRWLGIITSLSYILFMGIVILRIMLRSAAWMRLLKIFTIAAGIFWVIFSGLFLLRVYENESIVEAVVIAEKVEVMSAPAGAGTELFSLHEGVKVQIQDQSGTWMKIRLADGKVGWLSGDRIERI
jgi:hypothetical protein